VISPEKSLVIYRDLVDYLAGELDREAVCLQGETYLKVNDLVRYSRCDVAFVCTSAFVRGEQEFGMRVLVVPLIGGVTTYHSYIIVPQSSRVNSLLDLRGKRFASADILSNSGWLYPAIWLSEHGEDASTFFGDNHVISGSHDRSVTAVASGYVDGAAVDSLVYDQMVDEDPSLAKKTRIILKSPPFGMPPIVTHPGIDATLRKELLAAMLDMHQSEEGKKILASLRIDRFVVPEDELFDSVRKASKAWESPR
jgi:phosphonate transport system substrate-binding protein